VNILISWIGNNDYIASQSNKLTNFGPVGSALSMEEYQLAILLNNYNNKPINEYLHWLKGKTKASIEILPTLLTNPTDYKEIYETVRKIITQALEKNPTAQLTFHLSPGTPAMAVVWILLAPSCGAKLIQSSPEQGVQPVNFPFEIAAYYLPDRKLQLLSQSEVPVHAAFRDIVHGSRNMSLLVRQAVQAAGRDVTVLLEGESGTGKGLFARAIHGASRRANRPFVPINCGAIPSELVESELFGHVKGSFTGANKDKIGFFQAAQGGTIFLDEVGELPLSVQVKLLRALEERAILRVGDTKENLIDVRVIAATNKNLIEEVSSGNFREDLFYRLAVAVLKLPPLRQRKGDIELLADVLLKKAKAEIQESGNQQDKRFSIKAKKVLLEHLWPGNVRELNNTIIRTVLWSTDEIIDENTVQNALLTCSSPEKNYSEQPLGGGFSLKEAIDEITKTYVQRAMSEAGNVKTKAASLLGLKNYQTLSNYLKRYKIE
jgi:transcriptional regulator with GAF, ATPase, and Fis domain